MINELLVSIQYDSNNHPDLSRKNFYQALLFEISHNKELELLLGHILSNGVNSEHLTNLVAHAFEYMFVASKLIVKKPYSEFGVEDWKENISLILSSKELSSLLCNILSTKTTQTVKYQRYLGPFILSHLIFAEQHLTIADIGCSINLGLMGMSASLPFASVTDQTHGQFINKLIRKNLSIKRGIGLDSKDAMQDLDWVLACSFYPSEVSGLSSMRKTIDSLREKVNNVDTLVGDMREIESIWKRNSLPKVNVLIASTVLYQLPDSDRTRFLNSSKQILLPGGIIVINDFLATQNGQLDWQIDRAFEKDKYRTLLYVNDQFLEFLCWDSSRCKSASEGKDFNNILDNIKPTINKNTRL
jgi:hypothetical protein